MASFSNSEMQTPGDWKLVIEWETLRIMLLTLKMDDSLFATASEPFNNREQFDISPVRLVAARWTGACG